MRSSRACAAERSPRATTCTWCWSRRRFPGTRETRGAPVSPRARSSTWSSRSASRSRRTGLDYWPRVAPRLWPDWESFEQALPELGEALFFSAESERPLWDAPTSSRTVLVFGRESVGLPQAVRERWRERMVGFPMADPELRSLNLSTCVALALYEVLRRRAARAG